MTVMIFAKYQVGVADVLEATPSTKDPSLPTLLKVARNQAIRLFGWNGVTSSGITIADSDTQPKITWLSTNSFQTRMDLYDQYGWVAVADNAQLEKILEILEWPDGPLCRLYDITIRELSTTPAHGDVYRDMSPKDWEK